MVIEFPIDLHLSNDLSNLGIVVFSGWREDKQLKALKVRKPSNLEPFARSAKFLLDGDGCYVVEVTVLGEDIVGCVVRVCEQVGDVAICSSE